MKNVKKIFQKIAVSRVQSGEKQKDSLTSINVVSEDSSNHSTTPFELNSPTMEPNTLAGSPFSNSDAHLNVYVYPPSDGLGAKLSSVISSPAGSVPPAAEECTSPHTRQAGYTPALRPPSTAMPQVVSDSPLGAAGGRPAPQSKLMILSDHCPAAMKRSNWTIDNFDLREKMYEGNISKVYRAVDRYSGITVALKLYKRAKLTKIERVQVAREIELHAKLAHSSVIAMYAAWKDTQFVYMVLEWAQGGDVYSYIRSQKGFLAEEVAVPLILLPFLSGLLAIHERGLIHRDIKPENILLTAAGQVKIADFGLSIDSKREVANTRLGTIDYLAPEILDCPVKDDPMENKDKPHIGYNSKVDCWSVGVLVYEMLLGAPPFLSNNTQETLYKIKHHDVKYPENMSQGARSFTQALLVRDPTRRPSVAEMLMHPWLARFRRPILEPKGRLVRSQTHAKSLNHCLSIEMDVEMHQASCDGTPDGSTSPGLTRLPRLPSVDLPTRARLASPVPTSGSRSMAGKNMLPLVDLSPQSSARPTLLRLCSTPLNHPAKMT